MALSMHFLPSCSWPCSRYTLSYKSISELLQLASVTCALEQQTAGKPEEAGPPENLELQAPNPAPTLCSSLQHPPPWPPNPPLSSHAGSTYGSWAAPSVQTRPMEVTRQRLSPPAFLKATSTPHRQPNGSPASPKPPCKQSAAPLCLRRPPAPPIPARRRPWRCSWLCPRHLAPGERCMLALCIACACRHTACCKRCNRVANDRQCTAMPVAGARGRRTSGAMGPSHHRPAPGPARH